MWRISGLKLTRNDGENDFSLPCFYFNPEFDYSLYSIELFLVNPESGVSYSVVGHRYDSGLPNMSYTTFIGEVMRVNPYGFITDSDGYMFSVIDDISYKFLEFVKSIKTVKDSDIKKRVRWLGTKYGFEFWDKEQSLVDINTWGQHKKAFPLFQAICFAPDGLIDDKYYMWNMEVTRLYCIEFTDVVAVNRYINKATVSGYAKSMEQGIALTDAFLDLCWS